MARGIRQPPLYRGPVRRKRLLVGAPANIPVPIARLASRVVRNSGIVAKYAPSTIKTLAKYDVKNAGAI